MFYPCGHSGQGRDGNKTAYQSHGIWFARHGYVCLIVDSLQLGEIGAIHHGTYREGRWWWHSRGYTPAGVECWNGVRGIDYLSSRADVDPNRIAVTGISGGGAATFWIAAADERVKVAVPVSGMADLRSYVPNRVINGHCDCMFLYNTFQWPWTRIAALVAPRPLLFTNSDHDAIFPMDANDRVINRLKRVYSLYGAADLVDSMVSIGEHAYRKDLRRAAFRFINMHFKDDPRIVTDSERDLVTDDRGKKQYPIAPKDLRVFPTDADLPKDELNTTIDEHFVAAAKVPPPKLGEFPRWKEGLAAELRRVSFRYFPKQIPAARLVRQADAEEAILETEPGIEIPLKYLAGERVPRAACCPGGHVMGGQAALGTPAPRVLLIVRADVTGGVPQIPAVAEFHVGDAVYEVSPRGIGRTRWTRTNPPNYVERSHVLLGRTVDTGRVWDTIAAAALPADPIRKSNAGPPFRGRAGRSACRLCRLVGTRDCGRHRKKPAAEPHGRRGPAVLNILRVCDVPEALDMLAPRPLVVCDAPKTITDRTAAIYAAAGAAGQLTTPSTTAGTSTADSY